MRTFGQAEQLAGGAGRLDRRDGERDAEAEFRRIGLAFLLRGVRKTVSGRSGPSFP
jgi:hypothetical protein